MPTHYFSLRMFVPEHKHPLMWKSEKTLDSVFSPRIYIECNVMI